MTIDHQIRVLTRHAVETVNDIRSCGLEITVHGDPHDELRELESELKRDLERLKRRIKHAKRRLCNVLENRK